MYGSFMETGRLLIEIKSWDVSLYVGLSPDAMPAEDRFQGGLLYSRGIDIKGFVLAPKTHRTKQVRIWVSPVGPEVVFGHDGRDDVGGFYKHLDPSGGAGFQANLYLPRASFESAIFSLGTIWRYVQIWVDDDQADLSPVTGFSFSADIHDNLVSWASEL